MGFYPFGATKTPDWLNVVAFGADPTGMLDSTTAVQAAIVALPATGGVVYMPSGTYLISAGLTGLTSGQYLIGDGLWATVINFTGTGDCIYQFDASTYTTRTVQGGGVSGLTVNGSAAGAGSCALHAGDILQYRFDIAVTGFSGAGSVGIHLDNQNFWTEQCTGKAWINDCTQDVVFDCGGALTSNSSFDRGDFTFYISRTLTTGDSITFQNGAQLDGGRLRLFGNYTSSASVFTHAVMVLTGATPAGHSLITNSSLTQCELDINVESDEGLAHTFQTINYGATSNVITDCSGNISFGAGSLFTASNITTLSSQFTFLGPVIGDSTLGEVTIPDRLAVNSQAFFSSQVNFATFLYVTEHAAPSTPTGGGILYVDTGGNLHYLGPSATNTQIAVA